jgi:hypothetical protein
MQRASGIDAYAGGFYNDGGPGGGGASTVPKAGDFNAIQEEISRFIESKGYALAPGPDEPGDIVATDYQQLTNAINRSAVGCENMLLNPQLRFMQDLRSPWNGITATAEHLCDMWEAVGDGGAGTGSISLYRSAKAAGSESPWEFGINPSGIPVGKNWTVFQKVEGVKQQAGRSVSLSFMTRNFGGSGTWVVRVTQVFGTGGSPSTSVVAGEVNISVDATDTTYEATFELPSVSAKTLGTDENDHLLIEFEILTYGGTMFLSEFHLVAGDVTKTFKARSETEELRLIQRYFEKSSPHGETVANHYTQLGDARMGWCYRPTAFGLATMTDRFHVEKRAIPAMYYYSGAGGGLVTAGTYGLLSLLPDGGALETRAVNAYTATTKNSTGHPTSIGGSVTSPATVSAHWTADARL